MNFLFSSILITVEILQLFQENSDLDALQLGLQFIAVMLGSALSNKRMRRHQFRSQNQPVKPEFCLCLSYIDFTLTIVGVIVFLVQTQDAAVGHWNITPLVGVAIATADNQIVTTILLIYCVDCLGGPETGSVGVLITFVRQIWGFIGPFWFLAIFANIGVANNTGVAITLLGGVSVLPVLLLEWKGALRRSARLRDGS